MMETNPHRSVFWVPAISRESFERAYREIGRLLCIPGIDDSSLDIKKLVYERLNGDSAGDWLMIVDNADDIDLLMEKLEGDTSKRLIDYLPRSHRGGILFTTRSRKTGVDLAENRIIELHDMSVSEGEQMIVQRLIQKELAEDTEATTELLDLLAHLPLAIVQAVAFINKNGISISDYLSIYKSTSADAELFSEDYEDSSRYSDIENTIARTWHISFDQIRKQDDLAADFLSFMACMARDNIPASLLPEDGTLMERTKAIGTLEGYAFITERKQKQEQKRGERFFDIHRLVHMASVGWLKKRGEWEDWVKRAHYRLFEVVPLGDHQTRDTWTAYLSHAVHLCEIPNVLRARQRADLLNRTARCQFALAQYGAAERTHRVALELSLRVFGPEHPYTLSIMNEIALMLDYQGRYGLAEEINLRVLRGREKVLGMNHRDTLVTLNNLAVVLCQQAKYEEAEKLHRRELEVSERLLGKEHRDTLVSLSNLALVLRYQGKYEEAEQMNRSALAASKRILGLEHPETLTTLANLALVLGFQGKYELAEEMNRQALAGREKILGKDHPETLTSVSNLALVLNYQNKTRESERMNRRALRTRIQMLGEAHPETLTSMNNLAWSLRDQGYDQEALELMKKCASLRKQVLGESHPRSIASVHISNKWTLEMSDD